MQLLRFENFAEIVRSSFSKVVLEVVLQKVKEGDGEMGDACGEAAAYFHHSLVALSTTPVVDTLDATMRHAFDIS